MFKYYTHTHFPFHTYMHLSLHLYIFAGERNGNLLQYSYLGNPMDREAWWAKIHREAKESDKKT